MANTHSPLSRPPVKKRWLHRVILSVCVLAFLGGLSIVGISVYVGWNLSHPEREVIDESPTDYGLLFEDVVFYSEKDEVELKGWWIPAQDNGEELGTDRAVVFSHGYRHSRLQGENDILPFAKRLAKEGYHLLLFDYRGSGESGGTYTTIGQYETDDLLSAIAFVKAEKHVEEIAVIGWSMGAVSAILATQQSEDVQIVIADSPFANLRQYLSENLSHWSDLPDVPFTWVVLQTIPVLIGADIDQVSPVDAVSPIGETKLFLIHGRWDEAIPHRDSEAIFEAADGQAELWLPENEGHVKTINEQSEEYEERILAFLEKSFTE
ncbi:alpha/beta hydrolase [Halalkalibacterium halodurans]|uniref:Peptidase S9 prolyl oligopeptidase catalytic domain-containing protein n=1 Tax=Halalkalibacterium halodurans TaxID=86665 RepID=A0A0M0KM24_ALKHA|nr:alpha/beta hydrolase [Halalkalibacterium halodurans]MDY7221835.1 alpha/beta hydrolase [Halalkalibacterium halodurans]MDY7241111.1 alpha/beta hydrolase [Halalkalibacterium halodurans]MED3647857.1 alpha/beta hydrolase [Halalkalibacterium halodurans]MED4161187.1 alpha/beta hydrolase [Halalkalibacterium halodurans]